MHAGACSIRLPTASGAGIGGAGSPARSQAGAEKGTCRPGESMDLSSVGSWNDHKITGGRVLVGGFAGGRSSRWCSRRHPRSARDPARGGGDPVSVPVRVAAPPGRQLSRGHSRRPTLAPPRVHARGTCAMRRRQPREALPAWPWASTPACASCRGEPCAHRPSARSRSALATSHAGTGLIRLFIGGAHQLVPAASARWRPTPPDLRQRQLPARAQGEDTSLGLAGGRRPGRSDQVPQVW